MLGRGEDFGICSWTARNKMRHLGIKIRFYHIRIGANFNEYEQTHLNIFFLIHISTLMYLKVCFL